MQFAFLLLLLFHFRYFKKVLHNFQHTNITSFLWSWSCKHVYRNDISPVRNSTFKHLHIPQASGLSVYKSAPLYRHWDSVQAIWPIGGVEVQLCSFMTTALEGGEGSASCPGHSLPLGKTWYPLYKRLGGPQGWSGQVRKISPPPGFDPQTVSPWLVAVPTTLPGPHCQSIPLIISV
jgi:hypothetical protein